MIDIVIKLLDFSKSRELSVLGLREPGPEWKAWNQFGRMNYCSWSGDSQEKVGDVRREI